MQKVSSNTGRLSRMFHSPGILAIFLVVPALFILPRFIPQFRAINVRPELVLINNVCFVLLIALRFFRNLLRLRHEQRYGCCGRPGRDGSSVPRSSTELRRAFAEKGYRFDAGGTYGEKRNLAFLGATILYGGVLLTILVGSVDYIRQYSTVILLGVGGPMQLDGSAGLLIGKGLLSTTSSMPQLQVKQQILPSREWPHGATEIALLSKDNVELTHKIISWGGEPLKYRGFEYHMGRFLYDAVLKIVTSSGYVEFNEDIKLEPIFGEAYKKTFTHEAAFKGARGLWKALYDPRTKILRLEMTRDGATLAQGDVVFQKDSMKQIGGFNVSIDYFGNWSEIHVVRSRHMPLVFAGAAIALVGALMCLFFRPQRIWLEETPEGCRGWAVGREAKKLMKAEE
jgi:hypothetical protein